MAIIPRWRSYKGKQSGMFELALLRRWSSYKGGRFGDFFCIHTQKKTRILKFWVYVKEKLYYSSDLHLYFSKGKSMKYKKYVFLIDLFVMVCDWLNYHRKLFLEKRNL